MQLNMVIMVCHHTRFSVVFLNTYHFHLITHSNGDENHNNNNNNNTILHSSSSRPSINCLGGE